MESRQPFEFHDDIVVPEEGATSRSPGLMIEDAADGGKPESQPRTGKLATFTVGCHCAYRIAPKSKTFRVGKILNTSVSEASLVVHVYGPVTDSSIKLVWKPLFYDADGQTTFSLGAKQVS